MGSPPDETLVIVLVTGVPGVGKTTLCSSMVDSWPGDYAHISFGKLILKALNPNTELVTEPDLRRSAASLVTRTILAEATELLMVRVAKEQQRIVLVDSHAVSQDKFGYIVTPDGRTYFDRLQYGAIVQLHAAPLTILSRTAPAASGRQARSEKDIELHCILQSAISVGYSAASECPLYVVEAEEPTEALAVTVHRLLQGIRVGR